METLSTTSLRELIAHPGRLDEESLPLLRECVERYPYFQTARLLLLKNLYVLQDPSFEEELHRTVIYVGNRTFFYHFITDQMKEKEGEERTVSTQDGHGKRTLALIDAFLSSMPEESSRSNMFDAGAPSDYAASFLLGGDTPEALADDEVDAPETEEPTPMRGQELIDQFISQGADSIRPSRKECETVSYTSARNDSEDFEQGTGALIEVEDDDCFTETLAKIYIKQQRYVKALEIIKKLSLKYPKKTAYFADQIKYLEELIINTNSKK